MYKTLYSISKMDCPSEEAMIRMKFDGDPSVRKIEFDLIARQAAFYHTISADEITAKLTPLNLDAVVKESIPWQEEITAEEGVQRSILIKVLVINFTLFVAEALYGFLSGSMGLLADSLDMLADAFVYGLSLYAIGHAVSAKKKVAGISGYIQLSLAFIGAFEVLRRYIAPSEVPEYVTMIIVSLIALAGNWASLVLLKKAKSHEAHIKASMIFTSNDIIINLGVIVAAVIVYLSGSQIPDLLIGGVVFGIVLRGAFRIISLSK